MLNARKRKGKQTFKSKTTSVNERIRGDSVEYLELDPMGTLKEIIKSRLGAGRRGKWTRENEQARPEKR